MLLGASLVVIRVDGVIVGVVVGRVVDLMAAREISEVTRNKFCAYEFL